jgi:hypothetical protein
MPTDRGTSEGTSTPLSHRPPGERVPSKRRRWADQAWDIAPPEPLVEPVQKRTWAKLIVIAVIGIGGLWLIAMFASNF